MNTEYFNVEKIKRQELARELVGKTVCLKTDKSKTWRVVGRDNRGYVFLNDGSMQDVRHLVLVEREIEK